MSRIVVTGCDGFIGRILVRRLAAGGHEIVRLGRQAPDLASDRTWADLPAADHVVHLASRSHVPASWEAPASFIETAVTIATRALDYCRRHRAHIVFVSSYLYGKPRYLPIDEEHPLEPTNPYALSKHLADQIVRFYAVAYAVRASIVRPFNVFGPGQKAGFLVPTILAQVRDGRTIRVQDLDPRRDYVYVDDLVAALEKTVEHPPEDLRIVNIGSGESLSVRDVIDHIQRAAGTTLPVIGEDRPRPNEIPDVRADIRRARTLLRWAPQVSFARGIEHCLELETNDRGGK